MFNHAQLDVTASAQSILAALGITADGLGHGTQVEWISLQPHPSNAAAVFLGGSTVTTSSYGIRLEIPVTSVPQAPLVFDGLSSGRGLIGLGSLYFVGTASDKLNVVYKLAV